MTIVVDAGRAAEILGVDVMELARMLRKDATQNFEDAGEAIRRREQRERVDEYVERAQRCLDAAVACERAWEESLAPSEDD